VSSVGRMFPDCSPKCLRTEFRGRNVHAWLAPPVGIEPTTCGLGNLFECSVAPTSNIPRSGTFELMAISAPGDRWRRDTYVHSCVHLRTDIQSKPANYSMLPTGIVGKRFRTLLISRFPLVAHFPPMHLSSASEGMTWCKIIVRQWINTRDSHFDSLRTLSESWRYCRESVVEPERKWCGKQSTCISQLPADSMSPRSRIQVGEYLGSGNFTAC